MLTKRIIDVIENQGWSIQPLSDKDEYEIENHSDAGEDLVEDVTAADDKALAEQISRIADGYDVDEHVEMLIEAKRSGLRGVPGAVELVDDARYIQQMYNDLAEAVNNAVMSAKPVNRDGKIRGRLIDAWDDLSDEDKIELWNHFCEELSWDENYAHPVSELDDLYPLDRFVGIADVVKQFHELFDDDGDLKCEYFNDDGYGSVTPFDVDTNTEVNDLVNAIIAGSVDTDDLPESMQKIMADAKETKDDD